VKTREAFTLQQIDNMPPLLPYKVMIFLKIKFSNISDGICDNKFSSVIFPRKIRRKFNYFLYYYEIFVKITLH
jgi:hypothetical protein